MNYWDYPFQPAIDKEFQLDLGQGNTPMEKAPDEILKLTKLDLLQFKREDKNPNGSFKDRALAYQMSYLLQNKAKYCVLSSSGNAAISCCAYAQKAKIKPIILVSPNIPKNKLSQIINQKPYLLIKSTQARRFANYIQKKYHIPILNPSKDQNASIGFETLGQEIHNQNPNCDAIFSYSTSGASLIGIYNFYTKVSPKKERYLPRLYAIQTDQSQTDFYKYSNSKIIESVIAKSKASTITMSIKKNIPIQKILQKHHINSSCEGITALNAAIEFSYKFHTIKNITVIISGREHKLLPYDPNFIKHASTKTDIDQLLK